MDDVEQVIKREEVRQGLLDSISLDYCGKSYIVASFVWLTHFISSPEPQALDELIGWDSSWCPCIRPCVRSHFQT